MKLFSLLLSFVFCLKGYSQFTNLWYLTKGLSGQEERAWAVSVDTTGNIYWAIEEKDVFPYWYYNIYLYKISPNAESVWESNSWGWSYNDITFVAQTAGNTIYLGGRMDSTFNPNFGDALVLSYNASNANLNWSYVWDNDNGYEEIDGLVVRDDGIYLSGWTYNQASDEDFLVQKLDFNGQQQWTNSWDYNNAGKFDGANGHMAMDDNFIYAAGHVNKANVASFDGDMGLVCFSRADGSYQWNATWGGVLYDDALGMSMSSDSMLYIVGYTGSFGNGSQTYLNKYNRSGQMLWNQLWGGSGAEDSRAIVTDGDSIIYVVGSTSSYGNGSYDIFILKYNANGILLDSLIWGGAYRESAHDVCKYGDYLYITGETESYGHGLTDGDHKADALLLKINGRTMQAPDSSINAIDETKSFQAFAKVFPNPIHSNAVIQTNFDLTGSTIEVYNCLGQCVYLSEQLNGSQITLEKSIFKEGIYFFYIHKENPIATGKFMVE